MIWSINTVWELTIFHFFILDTKPTNPDSHHNTTYASLLHKNQENIQIPCKSRCYQRSKSALIRWFYKEKFECCIQMFWLLTVNLPQQAAREIFSLAASKNVSLNLNYKCQRMLKNTDDLPKTPAETICYTQCQKGELRDYL